MTLVDHKGNILDDVVSAKRGERLPTDLGLSKDVGICGANNSRFFFVLSVHELLQELQSWCSHFPSTLSR